MKPNDFWWGADQQVTVQNATGELHTFQVHAKTYQLQPGEVAKMPGYMAWVCVYELAAKLAAAAGSYEVKWIDPETRTRYYEKVVVGVDELVQFEAQEENPIESLSTLPAAKAKPAPGTGRNIPDSELLLPGTGRNEPDEETDNKQPASAGISTGLGGRLKKAKK